MSDITSAIIPIAPDVCPTTCSPIINSKVVVEEVVIEDKIRVEADGSPVPPDSKIPWILIKSGVFKDIVLSWTLVPHG